VEITIMNRPTLVLVAVLAAGLHGRLCSEEAILSGETAAAPIATQQGAGKQEIGIDEKLGQVAAIDVALKDETGKDVTLRQLLDRPTILTLNYFSCAGICTPLLNGLVDTLNALQLEPGKDFRVITVSFDPNDTPEIAARKRENYIRQMKRQFPPDAWRFLTGDAASTRKVTDSVGFQFRQEGKDFIHAGAIILLSPEGKVTRYLYGITFLPGDVQMAVGEAARGEARPTISKILKFCFSYDPASKQYVFNMTRVVGAFTLALVAIFAAYLGIRGRFRKETTRSPS
jgi:protein SCO1/2